MVDRTYMIGDVTFESFGAAFSKLWCNNIGRITLIDLNIHFKG